MALLAITGAASPQVARQTPEDPRIEAVTHGLRSPIAIKGAPSTRWTLAERMAQAHVPGVSIAVIDGGKIAWARGFGVIGEAAGPVTPATLFEAQSISKAVSATAALALVSSGQLSLDEPLNTYLKSWKVPANHFQEQEQVTLRRVLSHSAGFTVGGFEGYRSGDSLPSLTQILDGIKPANNPPIRVDFTPGSMFRYSGGGMEVLQQMLMDVTGMPFPALMQKLVLTPADMSSSTFEQPLPKAFEANAARGHDGNGVALKGYWPIQPELAAAGLWTTPTDLAKWALAITRASSADASGILSQRVATEMLTVQQAPYGLGVEIAGTGQAFEFSHTGSNAGYRAVVVMFPVVGKGAVIMANGDHGDSVIGNLITSIASEYHWPARMQIEREVVPLTDAQLNNVVGVYMLPPRALRRSSHL